jgi:hypothetical protein
LDPVDPGSCQLMLLLGLPRVVSEFCLDIGDVHAGTNYIGPRPRYQSLLLPLAPLDDYLFRMLVLT